MSDERLREAERKWKETGSLDDEARYLLERIRAGGLTQERLELAAYCGHEGAITAIGTSDPVPQGVSDWTYGLCRWGKEALVEAAVLAADHVVEAWATAFPTDLRFQTAIRAARTWITRQDEAASRESRDAGRSLEEFGGWRMSSAERAGFVAANAAFAAGEFDAESAWSLSALALESAALIVGNWEDLRKSVSARLSERALA